MKTTIFIALLAITAFGLSACKKEPFEPERGPYDSLEDFFASRAPQKQIRVINATSGATITGAKGSVIEIESNMFVHQDGSPVSGNIQIELIEIFSIADMIFSGVFPVSNGNVLNSGGEIYLGATQDGENLKIAPGAKYTITIPAQNDLPTMGFYSGVATGTAINWVLVDSVSDSVDYYNVFELDEFANIYTIMTDSIGWINCDDLPELTDISCDFQVTGHDSINYLMTSAYAIYDDYLGVGLLYYPDSTNTIHESNLGQANMHVLAISIVMGYLHYGIEPVYPEEGGLYTIPIELGTIEELEADLLDLL